jgi:hypothetical protein
MNQGTYSAKCSLDSVAEALVDLHAHVAAEPFGVGRDRRVERRIQVAALVLEAQHPAHVVHAGSAEGDLVGRHAHILGHLAARVLDRVAEPDDVLVRGARVPGPAVHGHRVGVVEHQRAGAQLGHVGGDALHDGDGAQGAEHGAHAGGVGDRLSQAVLRGDLEVESCRGDATDLDRVDGEVGALEGAAAIERRGDLRVGAQGVVGPARHGLGGRKTFLADVVQHYFGAGQFGQREEVA